MRLIPRPWPPTWGDAAAYAPEAEAQVCAWFGTAGLERLRTDPGCLERHVADLDMAWQELETYEAPDGEAWFEWFAPYEDLLHFCVATPAARLPVAAVLRWGQTRHAELRDELFGDVAPGSMHVLDLVRREPVSADDLLDLAMHDYPRIRELARELAGLGVAPLAHWTPER